MKVFEDPSSLERFRRIPWQFQQTFHTPMQNLQPFARAILTANEQIQGGCITIDNIVFDLKHLATLLAKHSLPTQCGRNWSLTVTGQHEVETLLQAALSDWVDFIFVPTPELFVIYADHDEYTTFYADTKLNLSRVTEALSAKDFVIVKDYERHF
jgi:hypothetical protein